MTELIKTNEPALARDVEGTVKWFNDSKGYGWVEVNPLVKDIFVHYTSIDKVGYKTLQAGAKVSLDLGNGPLGPYAIKVKEKEEE
jgi:cold shock protein